VVRLFEVDITFGRLKAVGALARGFFDVKGLTG
jgi:hypothetical protein